MILVVMGVCGCGKTTVGEALAADLGWRFLDADDYHPPANVEKMARGMPLTDDDRWPWLDRLADELRSILACSALKQRYRDRLQHGLQDVRWVYLHGTADLIRSRLQARKGHYMNPALLQSQFDALEPPRESVSIDVDAEPEVLAERVWSALHAPSATTRGDR